MTQPRDATPEAHSLSHTAVPFYRTFETPTMKPIIAVPAIAALVYRAYSRKSLTPVGIITALVTAVVHAVHPWSVFLTLLAVFFLAGNVVTKVHRVYLGEFNSG